MSFWGCQLKPGQSQKLGPLPDAEILHLSQVCLHEPKLGKNYVRVQVDKSTFTIACLEKDKMEHDSVDLFFGPGDTVFSNKGASEVHLLGYVEPKDDEDDAAEAKSARTKGKASPKATPAAVVQTTARTSPAVKPASPAAKPASPVASKLASPAMSPKANPNAKNSPGLIPEPKAAVTKPAGKGKADEEESDLDMEDEEGEEEEPIEDDNELDDLAMEGEEGCEEETATEDEIVDPKARGKAPAESPKRKAESPKPGASSPAKKPKAEPKEPKDIWAEDLVKYLKQHGKTSIAQLGTKVQKPAIKLKLSALLKEKTSEFKVEGEMVDVKK